MILPLAGLSVVEFEGIGPGPLAGRMLADLGADVVAVIRPTKAKLGDPERPLSDGPLRRGKRVVALDLKLPQAVEQALALVEAADALIEGNRPGVMERLRLGPADCAKRNPRLVYGRMTGWGQDGPLAQAAGHDLNYLALSGVLSLAARGGASADPPADGSRRWGRRARPRLRAHERDIRRRAHGQGLRDRLLDHRRRGELGRHRACGARLRDSGRAKPSPFHDSPFYDVYVCADGRYVTVGALEPQFYAALLEKLGLADVDPKAQYDRAAWPALKAHFRALFSSRPSAHWRALLEGSDACFAPVHEPCRGSGPSAQCGARRLTGAAPTANWTPPARRASSRSAEAGRGERNNQVETGRC